jgi:hypothetical protein
MEVLIPPETSFPRVLAPFIVIHGLFGTNNDTPNSDVLQKAQLPPLMVHLYPQNKIELDFKLLLETKCAASAIDLWVITPTVG